jgi:hypothetical protein
MAAVVLVCGAIQDHLVDLVDPVEPVEMPTAMARRADLVRIQSAKWAHRRQELHHLIQLLVLPLTMAVAVVAALEEMIPEARVLLVSQVEAQAVDAVPIIELTSMAQLRFLVQHVDITVRHSPAVAVVVEQPVILETRIWLINVPPEAMARTVLSSSAFHELHRA